VIRPPGNGIAARSPALPPEIIGTVSWHDSLFLGGGHPMDLDAKVCYCFHISRRKLVNFVRLYRPKVPSQLSECGGAGTGCGWCIPFLKQIYQQGDSDCPNDLEKLTPEEYAQMRAAYVRAGKGKPPPGATPLPAEDDTA